jgi:threonine/homoserine/homoserine lactone efflux protein
MPDWNALGLFIGAGLLLNITPGPDVLYIVGRSMGQGRLAGVVSALGISAGCLVHVAAAALGLSAVLVQLPFAYDGLRYAGALYLVWLGVRALGSDARGLELHAMDRTSLRRVFQQGVLTNVLNPKVALFFLAFLPQFTDRARGSLPAQFITLGFIFIVNGTLVCLAYALAASWLSDWLRTRDGASRWLNRAMGSVFLGLGLRLAFARW